MAQPETQRNPTNDTPPKMKLRLTTQRVRQRFVTSRLVGNFLLSLRQFREHIKVRKQIVILEHRQILV